MEIKIDNNCSFSNDIDKSKNNSDASGFEDVLSKTMCVNDKTEEDMEIEGTEAGLIQDLGLDEVSYKDDGMIDIMGMLAETKVKFNEKDLDGLTTKITFLYEKGKISAEDYKKALDWIQKERIALQYKRKMERKNDEFFKVFQRYFRE